MSISSLRWSICLFSNVTVSALLSIRALLIQAVSETTWTVCGRINSTTMLICIYQKQNQHLSNQVEVLN
ncbi:hypothetical protein Hanom_Chr03g00277731 [Helianthus anomalus]